MDKNSAETAAKTQFSFWAGARGPACKMGLWDVPPNVLGPPAAGGHPTKKHGAKWPKKCCFHPWLVPGVLAAKWASGISLAIFWAHLWQVGYPTKKQGGTAHCGTFGFGCKQWDIPP